ncbi:hypothetical protein XFF6166_410049 [Xanthomonas citri pv. fuscans]|nr:hypothetical protein XFF6166_410049 [Xanthomonas citri pv. fuscans]SOO07035.1 hypothetical protein XFF7767_90011 [Xanthomonas citri pv. fuscans]SOO41774.1 hypothetical protein XFF1815_100011 [Xanthomonas citri pv. fuscans]
MAAALSPQERAFFAQAAPDAQALANFGWRYEALAVLQWALGLADTLPEPSALCAVPLAAQRALDNAQAAERTTLARRPLPELLDTLDRHLRLHWAVRQAGGRSARPADPVSRYPPASCRAWCMSDITRSIGYCTLKMLSGTRWRRRPEAGVPQPGVRARAVRLHGRGGTCRASIRHVHRLTRCSRATRARWIWRAMPHASACGGACFVIRRRLYH